MSGPIEITGTDEVMRELARLANDFPEATAAALYEEGVAIEAASVPLVPVDTGRLRATHYTTPPTDSGTALGPVVTVGYGTDYALPVHERMDVHHDTGQAKYLETPLKAAASGFAGRMAARIKRMVEAGKGLSAVSARKASSAVKAAETAGMARVDRDVRRKEIKRRIRAMKKRQRDAKGNG